MAITKLSSASTALFVAAILLVAPAVGQDLLKPSDHDALGKSIQEWVQAKRASKGVDKAVAALAEELEKIKKRLKGRDPLSLTADLGKAVWESRGYDTQKGVKKGKVAAVKIPAEFYGEKFELEYAVYAPSKYNAKQAYPLILCIPAKGEKVTEHLTEKWIADAVRENAILVAVPMPDDLTQWSETGAPGKPGGAGNLLTTMGDVNRVYAVDFDRVYLAGRGEGVAAAMTIASRYPDRFAGIVGRSGDPAEIAAENFANLPTFFAGAGAGATAFAEKVEKLGRTNCTVKPDAQEADVWAWIQDHPRVSNPAEVSLLPGTPIPNKAYWLEVPPFDGQGRAFIQGKIDKGTNTITIEGEGVTSVILYFNDVLVDMDKPVKVLCNGAEHMDLIPRNLSTTLDLIYSSRSDPGKLYTAVKKFDLPVKPKSK